MDWGIDYPGESVARDEQRNESNAERSSANSRAAEPRDDGEAANGSDDLVLYVWVDAPIEYVSATKQYSERTGDLDWESVWKDGDGEIVHVIGRDIIQHHTVYWPAMLEAAGYTEPRAVCATGFVNIDGKGLSTSKNRAIWAEEYLDEGFHPDLLRYYVATASGFERDVNFSWDRFAERVNSELADVVGNFVYRALLFAARNFDGTPDVGLTSEVETEIAQAMDDYEDALNDYDLRTAGERAVALARFGNEYIQRNEPWKLDDDGAAPVIRDCVQLVKAVAVLLQPFTPAKAEDIWAQLGEDGTAADATVADCLQAPPAEFGEPEELFTKVEDDQVAALDEKLQEKIEAASSGESDDGDVSDGSDVELEPLADSRIGFEEFQDLDLRVGEIQTAEGIEGADDLARLEVDIGHEVRQIVAGIKQLHDLDALPGTKVVVVANLEQTELFGVTSDGMVLAAGEDADLLTTHEDSAPGTKVK
jgi:methionyl-tRNA synthetase